MISSCAETLNPPEVQPDLNRPLPLRDNAYLIETHQGMGLPALMDPTKQIALPGEYFPSSAQKIPPFAEYLNNQAFWQQWHSEGGGDKYRIVALIPQGTLATVTNYRIPPSGEEMFDAERSATIHFVTGPARGLTMTIPAGYLNTLFYMTNPTRV